MQLTNLHPIFKPLKAVTPPLKDIIIPKRVDDHLLLIGILITPKRPLLQYLLQLQNPVDFGRLVAILIRFFKRWFLNLALELLFWLLAGSSLVLHA